MYSEIVSGYNSETLRTKLQMSSQNLIQGRYIFCQFLIFLIGSDDNKVGNVFNYGR